MTDKLKFTEIVGVVTLVSCLYGSLLYVVSHYVYPAHSNDDFWGFLPSVWDHPEPNYVFFHWVCELFSVLTAIPFAGTLLMYNAWKYQYANIGHYKVIGLYCIICAMYSFAFTAHSTLSPLVMSITLTSVLTNGVYTFYQYSWVTKIAFLQSQLIRAAICIVAQSVIIYSVIKLPYMLGEYGGVPTLTYVQTPAVLFATLMVYLQLNKLSEIKYKDTNEEKMRKRMINVYGILLRAALLLCCAMAVSFVELSFSRENANAFGCFPYLHVTIHILEQIGIYNYGIGVAYLQYGIICNEPHTQLKYCGKFAYVHRVNNGKKIQ